jgi:hypothetical protein
MLPIRDDNPTRHVPYVTLVIIALNALVFLLWEPTFAAGTQRQVEVRQQTFFYCHAEIPYEITHQTNLAQGGAGARAAIDHAGDAFVPAANHLAGSELELEGLPPVHRAVEFRSVGEPARIMDRNHVTLLG